MGQIIIPCDAGEVSDGHHTFDELYDHRCLLFIALMRSKPSISWWSNLHADGSCFDGWWIGGMELPAGTITYHLPNKFRYLMVRSGVKELDNAPEWDGHTSTDVLTRMEKWLANSLWPMPIIPSK